MSKHKTIYKIILLIILITSLNCMSKNKQSKIDTKTLSGNYAVEYSFKVEGNDNKYYQKGSVSPWTIIQEEGNNIVIENVAIGNLKDSTITFKGGPLNFGAGYAIINNSKGIVTDSTIVGTLQGTYYDSKYGAGKFSTASFILRKLD